jgi:perosamine synthetase
MLRLCQPQIPESAIAQVAEILRSGNLVQGQRVREFESNLEGYLGVRHAIAVSSGTAALHVALLSVGVGPGDEVVVPAFTFPATANAVVRVGARPVLVDVSPDDLCMDPDAAERAISSRTRAIVPVHEFGQAARIDEICTLAERRGLTVIEDAACALGTEFDGKRAGTFGEVGCFSFHPRKALTTGEGGLLVTDRDELAAKMRAFRNHGIVTAQSGKTDFMYAGLNYRMTEFQAVLGNAQLERLEDSIRYRAKLSGRYLELLSRVPGITPPAVFSSRRSSHQTFHVIVDDEVDRDAVIQQLRERGIETNLGAQALNCLHFFRSEFGCGPEDFPNATRAYRRGLALPIGSHCDDEAVGWVVRELRCVLGQMGW